MLNINLAYSKSCLKETSVSKYLECIGEFIVTIGAFVIPRPGFRVNGGVNGEPH